MSVVDARAGMAPAGGARVRDALRRALGDLWRHSWRFFLLNAALAAVAIGVAVAGAFALPALVLALALGPIAAALVHCAIVVAQTDELRLADAVRGMRLHWLRGLELVAVDLAVVGLGALAFAVYVRMHAATLPLAFVVAYLVAAFLVLQLQLWPRAIAEPGRSLRDVTRDAAVALLRRPGATLRLALVLAVVNLAGIAAAVMPFLTLTLGYTALAAAHFVLDSPERED